MELHASLQAMIKESFPDPQLHHDVRTISSSKDDSTMRTPTKTQPRSRALSDSTPKLAPSPSFRESLSPTKRDDGASIPFSLSTRTGQPSGLSLVLPTSESFSLHTPSRVLPLSPTTTRIDGRSPYASPMSVLPRHSRGLDFSRAATHLHKSTLAESSPDSSPTITQKGMAIPSRKQSMSAMSIDLPSWQSAHERNTLSSSLGSVNMFASEDSSSDDDMEPVDPDEHEDTILTTPSVHRNTLLTHSTSQNVAWGNNFFSPASNSFLSYRRRINDRRSRKSSSSASGHSNLASPAPTSPAPGKVDSGYFPRDGFLRTTASRRQSLSVGTNELTISSGNDSGDEAGLHTPGVIRRVVTRRGNLLPKTRAFGRIKAELQEEVMPVESEVKREAEVIRQVRESDPTPASRTTTTHSSPSMQPITSLEDIPESVTTDLLTLETSISSNSTSGPSVSKGLFGAFVRHTNAKEYWDNVGQQLTPPPPLFPRGSSSADDTIMDSPLLSQNQFDSGIPVVASSRASTPQPVSNAVQPLTAADGLRKNNKRRRDDDLDTSSWKRRAVSPGVSATNSPILSQSPANRGESWSMTQSSQAKLSRESSAATYCGGHASGERSNSISSVVMGTPSLGPKRVGLQGMNDMQGMTEKMSLE